MSLYDRKYQREVAHEQTYEQESSNISTIVKETYKLLTASLIAATAGAYIGMKSGISYNWILFLIVELGLIFGMNFAVSKRQNTLALILLFCFTFITGFSLGPIFNLYISIGAASAITNAFLTTTVVFGSLTVYAINAKTDFSSWGKPLFFTLIAVIIMSLINIFIFQSSVISLAISAVSALLFSAYIIYDTQNIFKGVYTSPILSALNMYLNILNLFLSLLRLFGSRN